MLYKKLPFKLYTLIVTFVAAGASAGEVNNVPASVKALENQGLQILKEFSTGTNLRAFAALTGSQPIGVYLSNDGSVIVGTRLDAKGFRLDESKIKEVAEYVKSENEWGKLESSEWILDGKLDAPRVVYVFSDPNCPHCHRFWQSARPWVEAGKVQLRHIIVGIIQEDSPNKAASILLSKNRSFSLRNNEINHANGGIKPVEIIPSHIQKILEENQKLMTTLGLAGTPGIINRRNSFEINKITGTPQPDLLIEILGNL